MEPKKTPLVELQFQGDANGQITSLSDERFPGFREVFFSEWTGQSGDDATEGRPGWPKLEAASYGPVKFERVDHRDALGLLVSTNAEHEPDFLLVLEPGRKATAEVSLHVRNSLPAKLEDWEVTLPPGWVVKKEPPCTGGSPVVLHCEDDLSAKPRRSDKRLRGKRRKQ
jgi:hypothetical protein